MKSGLLAYYSSTGNTKLACEYLKNHLTNAKVELFNIAGGGSPDINAYDFVGLATFTDWGDPPFLVRLFVDKIPRQQNKPAFVLNTCAVLSGKTLQTLKGWLNEKGFKVIAGFTLKTPESYPPSIIKGITRADNPSPKNLKKFNEFILELDQLVALPEIGKVKEAEIKIGLINTIMPRFHREKAKREMGAKYVDKNACIGCGICQEVCPYQAINTDNKVIFDEDKCYGCWACFNNCPSKAIFTEKIKARGHYSPPADFNRKLKD